MPNDLSLAEMMEEEAREISVHSEFSKEDALWSLERALKYAKDCGTDDGLRWDAARDFVASAVMMARQLSFGLPEAVEYMIFSQHHRAHSQCEGFLPESKS